MSTENEGNIIEFNQYKINYSRGGKHENGSFISHRILRYVRVCEDSDATRKRIGIDGVWYDVSNFINRHPGGDVIEEYVGRDASSVFRIFHDPKILKNHQSKKQKTYEMQSENPTSMSAEEIEYRKLEEWFRENGFFETDYIWLLQYAFALVSGFFVFAYLVMSCDLQKSVFLRILAGLSLGFFWQQNGFFLHDFEHNQYFKSRKLNLILGTICGTVGVGVSGSWWRGEHYDHHLFTLTYMKGKGPTDPQMQETSWILHDPPGRWQIAQDPVLKFLVRFQHLVFLPGCFFLGRPVIMFLAIFDEVNWYEHVAFLIHWGWISFFLSYLPSWSLRIQVWYIAAIYQGFLHVQLLLSHYAEPHIEKEQSKFGILRRQAEATLDIITPWWLDWFWGGLNHHLAHHLYTKLPRHRLREATKHVRCLLLKHHIEYKAKPVSEALVYVLRHLKELSSLGTYEELKVE